MGTIREQILLASSLPSGTIRELLASPNTGTQTGGGELALEVVLQDPDPIIVSEPTVAEVDIIDADFDVKVVEKTTIITKE